MPNLYKDLKQCCGCTACESICPKGAISMVRKDGFDYPQVSNELCVECGLCEKVCDFRQGKVEMSNCISAYACKSTDKIRMESSSGGIFTALSDYILASGGSVYGTSFDEVMVLRHSRATTVEQRNAMRGSKYIQSNLSGIFSKIKEDVKTQNSVLFVGTPCQVAGLRAYLGKNYENLLTVDVICHGVPSPEIWEQFVKYINQKYKGKMSNYAFRNKKVAWRRYSPVVTFADGRVVGENNYTGAFIELFRYDVCMRPSCTVCPYASMHRQGDITIGDFWGVENVMPHLDDGKGVSAVMVNSQKGQEVLESVKNCVEIVTCTQEQIAARQPNMRRPSQFSNKAEAFQADWKALPFPVVLKKYTRVGLKRRVVDIIKKILGKA